tara:strand:+ start:700 stop:1440 length:741 start_codon:yes stop_codon:yes gene_type:complete
VEKYNTSTFIKDDPIGLVHNFKNQQDIEIFGLLMATLSWGNRKSIINSGKVLIEIMNNEPYYFIKKFSETDIDLLKDFKHRTFNVFDLQFFILQLQKIYNKYTSLEEVFSPGFKNSKNSLESISNFRKVFLGKYNTIRTKKHVANPSTGSAAKRLNMYLRWMVRSDEKGVDFGIWKNISTSKLSCPLDVHSGNSARRLKLLSRTQNDWKAVEELDHSLRTLDPKDPVKYDFALFGLGIKNKIDILI